MDAFLSELATEYAVFLGGWMVVAIVLIVVALIYDATARLPYRKELMDNTIMKWFLYLSFGIPYTLSQWIIE